MLVPCRCNVCGFEATCKPNTCCLKTGYDCEGLMMAGAVSTSHKSQSPALPGTSKQSAFQEMLANTPASQIQVDVPKGWSTVETSTEAPVLTRDQMFVLTNNTTVYVPAPDGEPVIVAGTKVDYYYDEDVVIVQIGCTRHRYQRTQVVVILKQKVYIIMKNEGGNYSPVLVTTLRRLASDKYAQIIKDENQKVDGRQVKNITMNPETGFFDGDKSGSGVTNIGDQWYEVTDEMGEKYALWFEEELIDKNPLPPAPTEG